MSYLKEHLLPWSIGALNVGAITFFTALATTVGVSTVTYGETVNLQSDWNIEMAVRVFLVSWLGQFSVAFLAYLKQSPIPTPK